MTNLRIIDTSFEDESIFNEYSASKEMDKSQDGDNSLNYK